MYRQGNQSRPVKLEKKTRLAITGLAVTGVLACSGCAAWLDGYTTFRAPVDTYEVTTSEWAVPGSYGAAETVHATVEIVKSAGNVSRISSRAIRLPSHPLRTITSFEYEFPTDCGGHLFRVYETGSTLILEFEYASAEGSSRVIRDYVTGPSPFIEAGLWTAYDHTGDGVSGMSVQYAKRGAGVFRGTYSQGPVTGLDASSRRNLGAAYDRAVRDTLACRG